MATKHVAAALTLFTLASAQARTAYDFPAHKDVSENNYSNHGFREAPQPMRFTSKSQIPLNETIMPHDRYHRIFNKVGDEYKYVTMIARLDRIKAIDLNGGDDNEYIKVKIESSVDSSLNGRTFYTRIHGLSTYGDFKEFDADVYMVQNIATEKLRVYQRICKDNSCPPKMIFETDFVSGEKKGDPEFKKNTHVGNYRIFEWEKFYQDRGWGGHYPSWYDPNFPEQPGPDDKWNDWFDEEVMPWEFCESDGKCSKKGMMRGAFGWYTALVEPHYGTGQWTHGTIGWGEDSMENIYRAKGETAGGFLANLITSLRSSGCSRVSNPSVAFLRHLLPPGTPLIKIYALEAYQDQASMERNYRVGEKSTWEYILTKDGVREVGKLATNAEKNYVQERGLDTPDNVLMEGVYEFNTFPSIVQHQPKPLKRGGYSSWREGCVEDAVDNYTKPGQKEDKKAGFIDIERQDKIRSKKCNVYEIPGELFKGRFYVDTGLIDGYEHPTQAPQVIKGGFRSQKWPEFFEAKNY